MARSRSELYQVDFVAALFGGFLLIWLSGANEATSSLPPDESPLFFSLQMSLGRDDPLYGVYWHAIVPTSVDKTSCVPVAWISLLYVSGRHVDPCHGELVNLANNSSTIHVATQAGVNMPPRAQVLNLASAVDISLLPPSGNDAKELSWLGRTIVPSARISAPRLLLTEQSVAIYEDSGMLTIGVAPRTWQTAPQILVRSPWRTSASVYDQVSGSAGQTSYRVELGPQYWGEASAVTDRVELKLRWDLLGANQCYGATLAGAVLTAATTTISLAPRAC